MRSINVYFDNEDFENLEKLKGDLSWKDFILSLVKELKGGTHHDRTIS